MFATIKKFLVNQQNLQLDYFAAIPRVQDGGKKFLTFGPSCDFYHRVHASVL